MYLHRRVRFWRSVHEPGLGRAAQQEIGDRRPLLTSFLRFWVCVRRSLLPVGEERRLAYSDEALGRGTISGRCADPRRKISEYVDACFFVHTPRAGVPPRSRKGILTKWAE